jgi:hypothetical protein
MASKLFRYYPVGNIFINANLSKKDYKKYKPLIEDISREQEIPHEMIIDNQSAKINKDYNVLYFNKFAHFCMPLNLKNQWKLFDLKNNVVTKMFSSTSSKVAIAEEVEVINNSNITDLAPKLIGFNISEGWYQEELISGSVQIPKSWDEIIYKYTMVIPRVIRMLLQSGPVAKVCPTKYINIKYKNILQMAEKNIDDKKDLNYTLKFTNSVLKNIVDYTSNTNSDVIYIGNTHGDFKFTHLFGDDDNPRLVDWEAYSARSIMFDYYNAICPWLIHHKIPNMIDTRSQFNVVIDSFISEIKENLDTTVSTNVSHNSQLYKYIYFFERVERTFLSGHQSRLELTKSIRRAIKGFQRFDEVINIW